MFKDIDSTKTQPTKEDVLAVLDFEINQIVSEQQRDGWTMWALYGVLASSLWLLLDQWEKGNVNVISSLLLFLVFSITTDIIHHVKRLLPHRSREYKRTLRFRLPSEVESPKGFFIYSARFIVLFSLATYFANRVNWIQAVIILLFYGFFSLFSLIAFSLYYFPNFEMVMPTTNKMSSKNYYLTWLIVITALIGGMIGYLNQVFLYYPNDISTTDLRVAGLMTVIVFIIFLLANQSRRSPLFSALIEIRRELAFGSLGLELAIRQAEIVIAGISVEEKLQGDISAILPAFEQENLEFNQIKNKLLNLSKKMPEDNKDITKELAEEAKEILLSCRDELQNIFMTIEKRTKLEKKLKLHVAMVENESPESVKSAKEVLEKIATLDKKKEQEAENMFKEIQAMVERLKEATNNKFPSI